MIDGQTSGRKVSNILDTFRHVAQRFRPYSKIWVICFTSGNLFFTRKVVGVLPTTSGKTGEIDFVVIRHQHREYFQIAQTLTDDRVFEREISPLRALNDSFPKTILTYDHVRNGITSDGIRITSIPDWLLGE